MKLKLLLFVFLCNASFVLACTGGTSAGTLTPTTVFQTIATKNGRYYTVNVTLCTVYEFTFCSGGGACAFDSQLTILDAAGTTQILYADDVCGTNAALTWTSNITGTIRILVSKYNCNHDLSSDATLAYKMTPKTGNYCLNGNASYQTIGGQSCIQLTPETNNQNGCAWSDQAINFNNTFNLSLNYYFGNNINGADGTTFTFQPNPGACGTNGGQLGAGNIPNSLVIEFDTYDNDNPAHVYDMAADHIAVEIDGNLQGPGAPYCGPVSALPGGANLDDGLQHLITINWNPGTQVLSISVDGGLRLSCSGNFVTTVFGGNNMVYWGATAATGGLNNQQYFCPSSVVLPVELTAFGSSCGNEQEIISWVSASENRLELYELEYTTDGQVFYPLNQQVAVGNSKETQTYSFTLSEPWPQQSYYRLKMIDENGDFKVSELIAAQWCGKEDQALLHSISSKDGSLSIVLNRSNLNYQLIDIAGRKVTQIANNEESFEKKIPLPQANGIYILQVWNQEQSLFENHRVFID